MKKIELTKNRLECFKFNLPVNVNFAWSMIKNKSYIVIPEMERYCCDVESLEIKAGNESLDFILRMDTNFKPVSNYEGKLLNDTLKKEYMPLKFILNVDKESFMNATKSTMQELSKKGIKKVSCKLTVISKDSRTLSIDINKNESKEGNLVFDSLGF